MSNALSFTPVPRQRSRHDGWSSEKQAEFIEALAVCGMVTRAAEKVRMNPASAYKLCEAEGSESFAKAWAAALRIGSAQLSDVAMDRAINGIAIPHFYKGEQVGEHRWYDNKLLMFMLRYTAPQRYGRFAEEVDIAERADREQAAAETKRLEQLERAEALLTQTKAELDEMENETSVEKGLEARTQKHQLELRRDRLESIIHQLRAVDTARAAEASIDQCVAEGRYSSQKGVWFKNQLLGAGP